MCHAFTIPDTLVTLIYSLTNRAKYIGSIMMLPCENEAQRVDR
jgi:hypothetical protein